MSIRTLRQIALVLLLGMLGALAALAPPADASSPVHAVGWSSIVDSGAGTVAFAIEFSGPPDFYAVDAFGRAQDEFQLSIGGGSPVTLVRGGEIKTLGEIPIRCGPAANACLDPLVPQPVSNSGGWGPVRALVPFTLTGNTVRFTVALCHCSISTPLTLRRPSEPRNGC